MQKRCIKKILYTLLVFSVLFFPQDISAQEVPLSKETVDICNQIMEEVFISIEQQKKDYPVLNMFTRFAFKKDFDGLNYIKYQNVVLLTGEKISMGAKFIPINDKTQRNDEYIYDVYLFPVLNLKLVIYQSEKSLTEDGFRILPIVKREARKLNDYESTLLPIIFKISTDKQSYQIGEPIEITVEMENLIKHSYKIVNPSNQNVIFTFKSEQWLEDLDVEFQDDPDKVIRPGLVLKKKFKINGLDKPQQAAIHANYLMEFQQINPSDTVIIDIIE